MASMQENESISIIVPFYKGNRYINRLLESVERVERAVNSEQNVDFEVIIVNDSPDVEIRVEDTERNIKVYTYKNPYNMGIQGTRVNGLSKANGNWIIFLDQDDELQPDGFVEQIRLSKNADVVVGNGIYQYGDENKKIYRNKKAMKYLIQKDRFIKIRNLIPSPGCCLIKRTAIPEKWINNIMKVNGADDWLLWVLMFSEGKKFVCNEGQVYIHNDAEGANLSFDLEKMKNSSMEMLDKLKQEGCLSNKEIKKLNNAIEFKYLQDTKRLSLKTFIKYFSTIGDNCIYKMMITVKSR